jgi:uncharacterized protein (PEP-CTERM system associated)
VTFSVLALAGPAAAGNLTITPSLELREIFSDNIDQAPDGLDESALTTEIVPGFTLRSESARATAALDVFPIIRHQTAGEDEGLTLAGYLAGLGTVEVEEDLFFVDAQASISQQVLNNKSSGATSDENPVGVFVVSPYLQNRFGGFAVGEARYRLSQVLIGDQDDAGPATVSDSTNNEVKLSLDSGADFSRLKWAVNALASYENRSEDDDVERWETGLEAEYAINRSISVLAAAGYQFFDDGEPANDVDDPTWQLGFRWRPGPRTDLRVSYGQRDGDESANVKFSYDLSSRTRITASYSEVLEKPQERLVRNVSFIDLDSETDQFIDPQTGLPFESNQSPFDINNQTSRIKAFHLGLNGARGRNTFSLNGTVQNETTEPGGLEEDVIGLKGRFARRITPHLTLDLFAGYEQTEFDDGQEDDEYSVNTGLSYRLYENLRAGVRYGFSLQNSNVDASEFTENRVTVSLQMTF